MKIGEIWESSYTNLRIEIKNLLKFNNNTYVYFVDVDAPDDDGVNMNSNEFVKRFTKVYE